MAAASALPYARVAPLWGELRYAGELLRLLADRELRTAPRRGDAPPVLLIPGFMAGDASLAVMRAWLRRRGHDVRMSGMLANVDCAGRAVGRLQEQLRALSRAGERPVCVIGQSRGGALARCLAVRDPAAVCGLVMLGTPVSDPVAVARPVLLTVRWLARLGDAGLPGTLSSSCWEGPCCADVREQLTAPLAPHIEALSVHSRSDGIVDWRACLDPHAQAAEVDSSHCGMSVHPEVFRALQSMLDSCAQRSARAPRRARSAQATRSRRSRANSASA
jgi:triacylglycerol lipase